MAISISYYGSKKPAANVKPQRTVALPDNTPVDKLPFGRKNPIDFMTGKHLVQLKKEEVQVADGDGRVKVTSADELEYLGAKVDDSIVARGGKIKLDGDEESPGNDKMYGTDGSGDKGWQTVPTSIPDGTAAGQLLMWNGTAWAAPAVGALSTGDTLRWDGSKWVKVTPVAGTAVGDIQMWNGTAWVNSPVGTVGANKILKWDSVNTRWVVRDAPAELPSGTNGQVLKHDGTAWEAVSTVTLNVVTGVTYSTSTHKLEFTYRQVTIIAYGDESTTTIETAVAES